MYSQGYYAAQELAVNDPEFARFFNEETVSEETGKAFEEYQARMSDPIKLRLQDLPKKSDDDVVDVLNLIEDLWSNWEERKPFKTLIEKAQLFRFLSGLVWQLREEPEEE